MSASTLTQENFGKLQAVIEKNKEVNGPLMPVMQQAQDIFGYLPLEVQKEIASQLGIPLTDVYGVATFYSQFVMEARGENLISVCLGTACYVKGAQKVMDALSEALAVPPGTTTADGKFTLEATRCLGCCGLAPVIMIGDDVYGELKGDAKEIKKILANY